MSPSSTIIETRHLNIVTNAIYLGYTDIVLSMLEKGVDVNAFNLPGKVTLLGHAAHEGHLGLVKVLLDAGADVKRSGGCYGLALQAAASGEQSSQNTACVSRLLEAGADVQYIGGGYNTALQAAASNDNTEVVELLLKHGADANAREKSLPALELASGQNCIENARLLIEHGAKVRDVDLRVAGSPEMLRILRKSRTSPVRTSTRTVGWLSDMCRWSQCADIWGLDCAATSSLQSLWHFLSLFP